MLAKLTTFLRNVTEAQSNSPANLKPSLELSVAVLLVEISMADFSLGEDEQKALRASLAKVFDLPASDIDELITQAHEKQALATSFHEYTRRIVDNFNEAEKSNVMTALWEIAYADGKLDPHEEHMLRKVADLLYIPHREFIRTKLLVVERQNQ